MLKISKDEMEYLTKHGVNFGENGISRTNSCHQRLHTYYLCESRFNMQKHYEYEVSIGIRDTVPVEVMPVRKEGRPYKNNYKKGR